MQGTSGLNRFNLKKQHVIADRIVDDVLAARVGDEAAIPETDRFNGDPSARRAARSR